MTAMMSVLQNGQKPAMSHLSNNSRSNTLLPKGILKSLLKQIDPLCQWQKNTEHLVSLDYVLFMKRLAQIASLFAQIRLEDSQEAKDSLTFVRIGQEKLKTRRITQDGLTGVTIQPCDILEAIPFVLQEFSS